VGGGGGGEPVFLFNCYLPVKTFIFRTQDEQQE